MHSNPNQRTGSTLILIISPLAADLSFVAEEKARLDPLAFGPGGAYAQAYSLFNCSMAVGVLFGPLLAGWLVEKHGYSVAMLVLGVFSLSGAVPCVSVVIS
jgi:MFS family permease